MAKNWTSQMRDDMNKGSRQPKSLETERAAQSTPEAGWTARMRADMDRQGGQVRKEDQTTQESHAQRVVSRDDGATRRAFAAAHPEYTGGKEGARTREANTAVVLAQGLVQDARERYGAADQKRRATAPKLPEGATLQDGRSMSPQAWQGYLKGVQDQAKTGGEREAARLDLYDAKELLGSAQRQKAQLERERELLAAVSTPEWERRIRDQYAQRDKDGTVSEAEVRSQKIKAAKGMATAERNKAKAEMDTARRIMTEEEYTAGGSWDPAQPSARYKEAEARYQKAKESFDDLDARVNELSNLDYSARNQSARGRMEADDKATKSYAAAAKAKEDQQKLKEVIGYYQRGGGSREEYERIAKLEAELREDYGLEPDAINAFVNGDDTPRARMVSVRQVMDAMEALATASADALEDRDAGYDFRDIYGYNKRAQRQEEAAQEREKQAAFARAHPVLSSVETVPMSMLQGLDLLNMDWGKGKPGEAGYIPPDSSGMALINAIQSVRGTISKDLERNTDWEVLGKNIPAFLYQSGMSIADSTAAVYTLGEGSVYLMGLNAATNTAKDVVDQGGTTDQAVKLGLAAGVAEVLFEKVSVENLLKPKDVAGWTDVIMEYVVKQGGIELSEEMCTEVANILAETAILGASSDYAQAMAGYRRGGMSEEKAQQAAFLDMLARVGWAGAGGFLSGAVMGGGKAVVDYVGHGASQSVNLEGDDLHQIEAQVQELERGIAELNQQTVERGAQDLGTQGRATMAAMYLEGQDAGTYVQGMRELYAAGRAGMAMESVESEAVQSLNDHQRRAAYTAGAVDRVAQANSKAPARGTPDPYGGEAADGSAAPARGTPDPYGGEAADGSAAPGNVDAEGEFPFYFGSEEGAKSYEQAGGVRVRDGGQRLDGAGAQGAAGSVEEGAGGGNAGADRAGPADAGAGALQVGRAISTYDLGIVDGAKTDSLHMVTGGETEAIRQIKAEAAQQGLELVLFTGGNMHVRVDLGGEFVTVEARGYISGNKVYIRADHGEFTANQLWRHELYHHLTDIGQVDPKATMREVRKYLGDKLTDKLEEAYSRALGGLKGVELWKEISADKHGGMNVFAGTELAGEMEALGALVGALTDEQMANSQTAQATDQRTGPPHGQQTVAEQKPSGGRKASIERLPDGRSYVKADRLVIFGQDTESWRMQLENYINEKIRNEQDVQLIGADGDVLTLTADTAGKVSSPYRGDGTTLSYAEYERKVNAGAHIDELAQVSRSQGKKKADVGRRHGEFASQGWDYRDAYFQDFDGKYYQITISAAVNAEGKIVYNIGEMRRRDFPNRTGSSAKGGAQGVEKVSPRDSIPQQGAEVKGKFSVEKVVKETDLEKMRERLQELKNEQYKAFRVIQDFKASDAYNDIMERINNADNDSLDALMAEYAKMEERSGIASANERYGDLTAEIKELSARVETEEKQVRKAALAEAREQYTPSFAKEYADAAEDMFGITDDFSLAGYLDTNGRLLDFSAGQGTRVQDHREIVDVLDFLPEEHEYSDSLIEFMNLGNIRIMSNGVDIAVEPNAAQREQLERFFEEQNGEVFVDFSDEDGKSVGSLEYGAWTKAERILRDIDEYFRTGEVPHKSELSKFRGEFSRESSDYIQELRELQKQNETLKKRLDYWMGQTRLSGGPTVDRSAVRAEASQLIKSLGVKGMTIDETAQRLQDIYDLISTGQKDGNELSYGAVREMAEDLARDVLSRAVVKDDSTYREYSAMRAYFRDTQLIISEADSRDIPDYGTWRREQGKRVKLRKAKAGEMSNVDTVFKEAAGMWPEFFSEAETSTPSDQVRQIAQTLEWVYQITEVNPYSSYMEEAVQWTANDIIKAYGDLPMGKGTIADQWDAKVRQAQAQGREAVKQQRLVDDMYYGRKRAQTLRWARERVDRVVAYEKARTEAKVAELKAWYRGRDAEIRDRQKSSAARNRLLKLTQRLERMKTTTANKALIQEMMGEIDTAARSLTGTKRMDLEQLRRDYQDYQNPNSERYNPDFVPDPRTEKALERLSRKHIDDMTQQDVEDLTKALLNLEHEIRTSKRLLQEEESRSIYQLGTQIIDEMEAVQGSKASGVSGTLDKYLTSEVLSPMRMVRRMVGWRDSSPLLKATEGLNEGQRTMLDYQRRAEKPFERFAKDKAFVREFSGPKAKEVKIGGWTKDGLTEVAVTPAMRASIYLHSLNPQNARHMAEGGVTVPDMKLYKKGELAEAYARGTTVKIKPSDTQRLFRQMSETERAFVRETQKYFREVSQPELSRVAEALRGYAPTMLENYFPIVTNKNFMKQEITFDADGTATVLKPGYLEERINASGPMMLQDVDSVVNHAIQQHGLFVGMAIPVRDFNKLWNVSTASMTEDGDYYSYAGSVKEAVDNTWGSTGKRYIEKMVKDVQGRQHANDQWGSFLDKLRGKYAGAVLTLNASVAIKQAASYPTAAAVLGWKPLVKAMGKVGPVDLDLIAKYTPLQWYRSKGFASKELGDMARNNSRMPALLNWIQGMDLITTRKLWKASEYYVRDHNKALRIGSDAYYQAVAEIYNRVIEETQPNYTAMQRPQLLRSESDLMKNLAMFKTQPMQNLNILYDAVGDFLAKRRQFKAGGIDVETMRQAGRNLGNAMSSQLVQAGVFAGMTLVWALFRGRMDKYKDPDKDEVTAESLMRALGVDAGMNVVSGIPIVPDLGDYLVKKVKGEKAYSIDVTSVSMIMDTVDAVSKVTKMAVQDVSGKGDDLEGHVRTIWDAAEDISKGLGIPMENVTNLFTAGYRHIVRQALGEYRGEYEALKVTTDRDKYPQDYYDNLYKAMVNDQRAYRDIYEDMVKHGWDEKKIKKAMEDRMKKAQNVGSVAELDHRYVSPGDEADFDKAMGRLEGSRLWRKASAENQDKAKGIVYDLVVGDSKSTRATLEKLAGTGIDEGTYALYKLAAEMADEANDDNGSITNAEREAAIRAMEGLSDAKRAALWIIGGGKDKSNPWG